MVLDDVPLRIGDAADAAGGDPSPVRVPVIIVPRHEDLGRVPAFRVGVTSTVAPSARGTAAITFGYCP